MEDLSSQDMPKMHWLKLKTFVIFITKLTMLKWASKNKTQAKRVSLPTSTIAVQVLMQLACRLVYISLQINNHWVITGKAMQCRLVHSNSNLMRKLKQNKVRFEWSQAPVNAGVLRRVSVPVRKIMSQPYPRQFPELRRCCSTLAFKLFIFVTDREIRHLSKAGPCLGWHRSKWAPQPP